MARKAAPRGTFHDLGGLDIPTFGARRVQVYVPGSPPPRNHGRPALVMLDGQNVFGDEGSFAGGWHAHDAVDTLIPRSYHVPVIVAVDNGGLARMDEYTPWEAGGKGGRAGVFVDWLADSLLPRIRSEFGTADTPVGAAICGSSLGGLAALYAHYKRPDVFGGALAMSSAFFWAGRKLFDFVAHEPNPPFSRIYVDCGAKESGGRLLALSRDMAALLASKGYDKDRLLFRPDSRGGHNEKHWRRRLPRALRFMYRKGA